MSERRPSLIVISAPSGAGKSTVVRRVLAELPSLRFSVSHTTRAPRAGEQDGVAEGDRVVVSANFLIDAESNLKAALQSMTAPVEEKPQ